MCRYCNGIECFEDAVSGISIYIAFDNVLKIDSDGGIAYWDINYCPMCGRELMANEAKEDA